MVKSSRKTKKMRVRLTEAEWEYITSIADARDINLSEALRWLIHQSVLVATILLEEPRIIQQAKQKFMEFTPETPSNQ